MDERIRALAESIGADYVAQLPKVGHGAFGAAHYAAFYRQRMAEIRKQQEPEQSLRLPIKKPVLDALDQLAQTISEPGKPVTREDLALLLLFESAERMLDRWRQSHDKSDNVAQDEFQRRKEQIENAKLVLCEAIGLNANQSAAG